MKESTAVTEREAFVRAQTRVMSPPLCPELSLHAADELTALWQSQEATLTRLGIDTPYWCIAWAGGQALARFVLDHPHTVRGRQVLDLGCGSGLCALAASSAGATRVWANDPDPLALAACALNASHNDADIETLPGDLLDGVPPQGTEVILAADLWFQAELAMRVTCWLHRCAAAGIEVLVGDPHRAYLPRTGLEFLERYQVPTSMEIERSRSTRASGWRLGRGKADTIPTP